jgi:hypothetical protein
LWDFLEVLGDSIMVIGLALFGTIAIVRPKRLQTYYRGVSQKSAVARMWPATLVLKPWYVFWLRFGGILLWGFAVLGAYAIWLRLQH